MPKGKKFDAAEKHFKEKEDRLRKEIISCKETISCMQNERKELKSIISKQDSEIAQYKDWIERLLSYTQLSEDDIKKVCAAEARQGEALKAFTSLLGATKMFGGVY